jgi:hypothetical protein
LRSKPCSLQGSEMLLRRRKYPLCSLCLFLRMDVFAQNNPDLIRFLLIIIRATRLGEYFRLLGDF